MFIFLGYKGVELVSKILVLLLKVLELLLKEGWVKGAIHNVIVVGVVLGCNT